MFRSVFWLFCLNQFLVLSQAQYASIGTCGLLTPPPNSVITGCTKGGREGSRCTVRCDVGFRQEETTLFCNCLGFFCMWQGNNPTCEGRNCPIPENSNGRISIIDKWSNGFAGIIEFNDVPEILLEGWSILILFNKNLGPNAQMSSWSSELTAVSTTHDSFTLSNIKWARNATLQRTTHLRSMFVVSDITGKIPAKGYVGMYHRRVKDATCYQPSSSLAAMQELPMFATDRREPGITAAPTTTKPTTTVPTTPALTKPTTPSASEFEKKPLRISQGSVVEPSQFPFFVTTTKQPKITPVLTTNLQTTLLPNTPPLTTNPPGPTGPQKLLVDGMRCIYQRASNSYRSQQGWTESGASFFSGNAVVYVPSILNNWLVVVVFQRPIASLQVWNTVNRGSENKGLLWKLGPQTFNQQLHPGILDVNFIAEMASPSVTNPRGEAYLCSMTYTDGDPIRFPDDNGIFPDPGPDRFTIAVLKATTTAPTTTAARVGTGTPSRSGRCSGSSPVGIRPSKPEKSLPRWKRSRDGTKYNYNELLAKSIYFYEIQRSGLLPSKFKRVKWRGDSMLKDGCSVDVDLSRGWFDAGDYVKFTFPMASAVTTLAWGGIVFRKSYRDAAMLLRFLGSIKWPAEYLIKTHLSPNELVALVGNVQADHSSWSRPEDWRQDRPVYTITADRPGSELAGETAAALASVSILTQRSHKLLSAMALEHAQSLYQFATTYKGDYHKSVPEVREFYRSASGYADELIWAAAWLYKATNNRTYLQDAERLYRKDKGPYKTAQEYSWDNKLIGAQILLANLTGEDIYRSGVARFMHRMLTTTQVTPQGMLWIRAHGPNRYAANAAMMAILAYGLEPPLPQRDQYIVWARKQIHLLLGDAGRSYVVGFGKNYPKQPHHRASSCPPPPAACDWNTYSSPNPNHFILHGALVGGPNKTGHYLDLRSNYQQSEVAIDYNAGFQSAIAGLKYYISTESRIATTTTTTTTKRTTTPILGRVMRLG